MRSSLHTTFAMILGIACLILASASLSLMQTASGTAETCAEAQPPQLEIGQTAHLHFDSPQVVFEEPRDTRDLMGQIEPSEQIDVVDGPVCGAYNGRVSWWFQVKTDSITGWLIEAEGATYLIESDMPDAAKTSSQTLKPQVMTLVVTILQVARLLLYIS